MKLVHNLSFWLLMVICVALIVLVKWQGITSLVTFLAIMYVAIGGLFTGMCLSKPRKQSIS